MSQHRFSIGTPYLSSTICLILSSGATLCSKQSTSELLKLQITDLFYSGISVLLLCESSCLLYLSFNSDMFGHFFSRLSLLFSFSPSLGDGPI